MDICQSRGIGSDCGGISTTENKWANKTKLNGVEGAQAGNGLSKVTGNQHLRKSMVMYAR